MKEGRQEMKEWQIIKDKLNNIKLTGCKDVKVGDVLHYALAFYYDDNYDFMSILKSIRRIIGFSFLKTYDITVTGEGKNLFLISNSIRNRMDHMRNMHKVMSLVENRIDVVASGYKLIFSNFMLIRYVFLWYNQLRNVMPDKGKRIFYISHLYKVFLEYSYVNKKLRMTDIRSLITYCDVLANDNFFVQKMNNIGITTVTLQHGVFGASSNMWAITGSISDYFFVQGQYMLNIADRLDFQIKNKMVKVGLVSYADEKLPIVSEGLTVKTIGVFLDGGTGEEVRKINMEMICIAEELKYSLDVKILYKFHPTIEIDDYSNIKDRKVCFGRETFINDFIDKIDAGIVHNSTSFVELLYKRKLAYLYKRDNLFLNEYKKEAIMFSNADELNEIVRAGSTVRIKKCLECETNYFIEEGDPCDNFKNAFAKLGII